MAENSIVCGSRYEVFGPCVKEMGHDGHHRDANESEWTTRAEMNEKFPDPYAVSDITITVPLSFARQQGWTDQYGRPL